MIRRLLSCNRGAGAAEFALVLPVLLMFLFGIIDGGRWLWTYNRAEKATQMGARMAVVANTVAPGIRTADYVGVSGLTQGDRIPASAFGKITCSKTGASPTCTCTTTPCPTIGTVTAADFTTIYNRMHVFLPEIAQTNLSIEYSSSGLGFAGNPNGPDINPLVTVRLTGMQFHPITTLTLATMNMPDFHTSLTLEDGVGAQSN